MFHFERNRQKYKSKCRFKLICSCAPTFGSKKICRESNYLKVFVKARDQGEP